MWRQNWAEHKPTHACFVATPPPPQAFSALSPDLTPNPPSAHRHKSATLCLEHREPSISTPSYYKIHDFRSTSPLLTPPLAPRRSVHYTGPRPMQAPRHRRAALVLTLLLALFGTGKKRWVGRVGRKGVCLVDAAWIGMPLVTPRTHPCSSYTPAPHTTQ